MDEFVSKKLLVAKFNELASKYTDGDKRQRGLAYTTAADIIAFTDAANVQPVDRWINAQINPPIATDGETSDYVLVLRTSGGQCVCYYVYDDDEGNYWCSEDEKSIYEIDEVTHWQPLPEPPKQ